MTTIRLRFTAARYHATPWGRHVNEGVAEWPPSPYRLLRALFDVWQRKCFDFPENHVRAVLEGLASEPPNFQLPPAVATHTRSYLNANSKDPTDKNLVFDPFLVFDHIHACFLCWPKLELPPEQQSMLSVLLENLNYLGRSESWVQAELWNEPIQATVTPSDEIGAYQEQETVACVIPATEFRGRGTWLDALTYSTFDMTKERASSPPLLRQVRYALPRGSVVTDPPPKPHPRPTIVQAVTLSLDSTVLPLVTASLDVAEQVRVRLMGAHRKRMGDDRSKVSPLFSGKSSDGKKRLDHGHVYILPQGNANGRIDRILIYSRFKPFDVSELDAIRSVRELYQSDGRPAVRCILTWQGTLEANAQFGLSAVLQSTTPFVPPRHWRKGRDFEAFLASEVRRELQNHGISTPVTHLAASELPSPFHITEYRRNRKDDPVRPAYALRITFADRVQNPFAIGYGAHFGLGQFSTWPAD